MCISEEITHFSPVKEKNSLFSECFTRKRNKNTYYSDVNGGVCVRMAVCLLEWVRKERREMFPSVQTNSPKGLFSTILHKTCFLHTYILLYHSLAFSDVSAVVDDDVPNRILAWFFLFFYFLALFSLVLFSLSNGQFDKRNSSTRLQVIHDALQIVNIADLVSHTFPIQWSFSYILYIFLGYTYWQAASRVNDKV